MITEWDKVKLGLYDDEDSEEEELDEDAELYDDALEIGFIEDYIRDFEDD